MTADDAAFDDAARARRAPRRGRARRDRPRLPLRPLAAPRAARGVRAHRRARPRARTCRSSSTCATRTPTPPACCATSRSAPAGGVIHCFTGDAGDARRYLDLGLPPLDLRDRHLPERRRAPRGGPGDPARSPPGRDRLALPRSGAASRKTERTRACTARGRGRGASPGRAVRRPGRGHDGQRPAPLPARARRYLKSTFKIGYGPPRSTRGTDPMIVCSCRGISDRDVVEAVRCGARTLEDVSRRCDGAGADCGSCIAYPRAASQKAPASAPRPRSVAACLTDPAWSTLPRCANRAVAREVA